MFIRIIFYILLLQLPSSLFSIEKKILLKDLNFLGSVFQAKYAPKEWKENYASWTLEEELEKAKAEIRAKDGITTKDYHQILSSFFRSTRDFHVAIHFYSSEKACLPFSIYSVRNRYFVTKLNPHILNLVQEYDLYSGDELKMGCEILTFDDRPISSVIRDLKNNYVSNSKSLTAKQLACRLLTYRKGALGHPMPKDPITRITFNTPTGKLCSAELAWLYIPEEIVYKSPYSAEYKDKKTPEYAKKIMYSPLAQALIRDKESTYEKYFQNLGIEVDFQKRQNSFSNDTDEDRHDLKRLEEYEKVSNRDETHLNFISNNHIRTGYEGDSLNLGRKIWKSKKSLHYQAYIYKSPTTKKKIGYIRIPTYLPVEENNEYDGLIKNLAQIIKRFESTTDALVVDQTNNEGGMLLYGYAVASMLTDRPLKTPSFEISLTPKEVNNALEQMEAIKFQIAARKEDPEPSLHLVQGYPDDIDLLESYLSYVKFIVAEWNKGKTITSNFPMLGIKKISPHPMAHYSKPILMLVNCLDFSTADFIPAILQDEKRAVIFGEKTAGAGGAVEKCSYPNLLGVASFSFTTSFAKRISGTPIENLGITPDIAYTQTVEDLTGNQRNYKRAINKAVEDLLSQ